MTGATRRERSRACSMPPSKAIPALAAGTIEEMWSGFRPFSPDGYPLVGPSALPGYYYAVGHHKLGIQQAPITAEIMSRIFSPPVRPLAPSPTGTPRALEHRRTDRKRQSKLSAVDLPVEQCGQSTARLLVAAAKSYLDRPNTRVSGLKTAQANQKWLPFTMD